MDNLEFLYVTTAFLFQTVLIIHFALRKRRFELAMRYGPLVYALSMPAAAVSVLLLLGGKPWSLWLSGFIYLAWAILGPYVTLYLATVMFYWFPLAQIYKPLWYVYGVLFVISTILNVTSHRAG
jgi:hypothetical protein